MRRAYADGGMTMSEIGQRAGLSVSRVSGPQEHSQLEYLTRPTVARLGQFAVDAAYQGHGVGFALIDAAIACAIEDGFEEAVGDVVATDGWVRDWYERIGFLPVEEFQWEGRPYRSVLVSRRLTG